MPFVLNFLRKLESFFCHGIQETGKNPARICGHFGSGSVALEAHGLGLDDFVRERESRRAERGAFGRRLFLEWTGEGPENGEFFQDYPVLIISPQESDRLVRLIKSELARCTAAYIASAFFPPGY